MQQTLTGKPIMKWFCTHCPWVGFNPKIELEELEENEAGEEPREIECCPKCSWACYNEKEAPRWAENYKILEQKLNRINRT